MRFNFSSLAIAHFASLSCVFALATPAFGQSDSASLSGVEMRTAPLRVMPIQKSGSKRTRLSPIRPKPQPGSTLTDLQSPGLSPILPNPQPGSTLTDLQSPGLSPILPKPQPGSTVTDLQSPGLSPILPKPQPGSIYFGVLIDDRVRPQIEPGPDPGRIVPADQFTDVGGLRPPGLSGPYFSTPAVLLVGGDVDTDGDGRVGAAEDADGDATYGTLDAAWARVLAAGGGEITFVANGTYAGSLAVAAGSAEAARWTKRVTLSAASGVAAVLTGAGGGGVDLPGSVVVRGLTLRGFSTGVAVRGGGNLLLDNCVIEDCAEFGVYVADGGTALIRDCSIVGTGESGLRPATSIGVCFERASSGQLRRTAIWESQGTGLVKRSKNVRLYQVDLHHNRRDVGR